MKFSTENNFNSDYKLAVRFLKLCGKSKGSTNKLFIISWSKVNTLLKFQSLKNFWINFNCDVMASRGWITVVFKSL